MSQDEVKELLERLRNQVQPGTEGFEGWQKPQPSAFGVQGVNVPINVQTSAGNVRVYFQLPAEVAVSPDALIAALENMLQLGIPVDTWTRKSDRQYNAYGNNRRYQRRY
jgi:hypothetical protein